MLTHNNHLLVPVPKGLIGFQISNIQIDNDLIAINTKTNHFQYIATLPPGSYTIIGLGDSLTEEQWKEIVEEPVMDCPECEGHGYTVEIGCCNNPTKYGSCCGNGIPVQEQCCCNNGKILTTAKESGLSLLSSHNLQEGETVILKIN